VIADRVDLPEDRRHFQPSFLDAAGQVAGLAQPGDVVLTIGAGDVTVLGPEVLKALG
jgi:UDP-N-acetylmuramate--alanine ligase